MNKELLQAIGLLLLRLSFGGFMMVHGIPKLMAYSKLATSFPDPIGIGSNLSLIAAIAAEVGCSLLIIAGLGTRLATLPLAFTMIIAMFVVHGSDPWKAKELAACFLAVYAVLAFTGPGKFSLDHLASNYFEEKRQKA